MAFGFALALRRAAWIKGRSALISISSIDCLLILRELLSVSQDIVAIPRSFDPPREEPADVGHMLRE